MERDDNQCYIDNCVTIKSVCCIQCEGRSFLWALVTENKLVHVSKPLSLCRVVTTLIAEGKLSSGEYFYRANYI